MLTTNIIWYKDYGIEYDDSGYWTVQYCGDEIIFDTVDNAKEFIDEIGE